MSVAHRVRLPAGATPVVKVGDAVEVDEVLATRRPAGPGVSLAVAWPLRRAPSAVAECFVVRPGATLEAGDVLASTDAGRDVRVPTACLFLGYDPRRGTALLAPLGALDPILGHVRGEVAAVAEDHIELRVAGAAAQGVGGTGRAVHGELRVAVSHPGDELRAAAIDAEATGKIVVGGSRASAETLTRARAMGVAGIVLGGILDKELRDFESAQLRRREVGGVRGEFGVLLLEGYGKVGLDVALFRWLQAQDGRMASLFGAEARLYVYGAEPPPERRALPRPGGRVVAHRRPYAGVGGDLLRVVDGLYATQAGVVARSGVVRFEDGRTAIVPLANLEATEPLREA